MIQENSNLANNAKSILLSSLQQNWKLLSAFAIAGGITAAAASVFIPEKYVATGIVSQSRFAGQDVETLNALIDKMRLITFYSDTTLTSCGAGDDPEQLINKVNPSSTRDGKAVKLGIKLESREAAINCLNAIVKDINIEQLPSYQSKIALGEENLNTLKKEYALLLSDKTQEFTVDTERLDALKDKLASVELFISDVRHKNLQFDFKDEQFSAMSLLLTTLLAKENEAQDLRVGIRQLSQKLESKSSDFDNKIVSKEAEISMAESNLEEPQTSPAQFVVPIASPKNPIQPLRGLMAIIGLMMGALVGLIYISFRKATA